MSAIELLIAPADQPGNFTAKLDGRMLVRSSRQPFLDAARVLLAEGYDPATRLVMRHAGSDIESLRATIGAAAKLTVRETNDGPPRFVYWQPFPAEVRERPLERAFKTVPGFPGGRPPPQNTFKR